jgi:hypothetical protein
MADKIVLITAQKPITGSYTYLPKPAVVDTPNIVAAKPTDISVTAAADTSVQVSVVVTNMGEESLVNPSLFKRVSDFYELSDTVSLTYSQKKLEQVGTADDFTRTVQYGRVFPEYLTTGDSYKTFFNNKVLQNTVVSAETSFKQLSKIFTSEFTRTDVVNITYGKLVRDAANSNDTVYKYNNKGVVNVISSSDTFARVLNLKRNFADLIDATDDFYGAANIDDDQIAYVGKTLVNWATSSDIKSVVLNTYRYDTAAVTELNYFSLTKPLADVSTVTELIKLSPQKVLLDTFNSSDKASFVGNKVLLDVSGTADSKTVLYDKKLSDIGGLQDTFTYTGTKSLQDQYGVTDGFSSAWQAYRVLYDYTGNTQVVSFNIAPSLLSYTQATERTEISSSKELHDYYNTSDSLDIAVGYKRTFID